MGALGTRQRPRDHYGNIGNKETYGEHYGSPGMHHGAQEQSMGAQERGNTRGTGMGAVGTRSIGDETKDE